VIPFFGKSFCTFVSPELLCRRYDHARERERERAYALRFMGVLVMKKMTKMSVRNRRYTIREGSLREKRPARVPKKERLWSTSNTVTQPSQVKEDGKTGLVSASRYERCEQPHEKHLRCSFKLPCLRRRNEKKFTGKMRIGDMSICMHFMKPRPTSSNGAYFHSFKANEEQNFVMSMYPGFEEVTAAAEP
jgi:hypothetical protein